MEDKKREQSLAQKLFCIGFFALLVYLVFKYAISALLPFVIAWAVSLFIIPLARFTAKKTKIPQKVCGAVYVTLIIAALAGVLWWATSRLANELGQLIERVADGEGELADALSSVMKQIESLGTRVSFLKNLQKTEGLEAIGTKINEFLSGLGGKAIGALSTAFSNFVSGIVSRAPDFFIGFFVTLMACYYFSMDDGRLREGVKSLIPTSARDRVVGYLRSAKHAMVRYAQAYLLLMAITFVIVFIGLIILKIKYSFLIALGVAFVDFLPLLGAGAVLVPWLIVAFLLKKYSLALGLLIIFAIVSIVRQVAEPHVVGGSIGLHPAASLFSMYVGFKFFGVLGMILGPAAALMIKEIINGGRARENSVK